MALERQAELEVDPAVLDEALYRLEVEDRLAAIARWAAELERQANERARVARAKAALESRAKAARSRAALESRAKAARSRAGWQSSRMRGPVAGCEGSGHVNSDHPGPSSASGKYGFIRSTWDNLDGVTGNGWRGYPTAKDAPESVQDEAFDQLWDDGRGAGHWARSRNCWEAASAAA